MANVHANPEFDDLLAASFQGSLVSYVEAVASSIEGRPNGEAWKDFEEVTSRAVLLSYLLGIAQVFDDPDLDTEELVDKVAYAKPDCGANAEGGGGFQPGNTCAGEGESKDEQEDRGEQGKKSDSESGGEKPPVTSVEESDINLNKWMEGSHEYTFDEDFYGSPKIFYHGSMFYKDDFGIDAAVGDEGIWFSTDKETAESYAYLEEEGEGHVYETHIRMENPLIIEPSWQNTPQPWYKVSVETLPKEFVDWWEYQRGPYDALSGGEDTPGSTNTTTKTIAYWAKKNGYDGVVFKNTWDMGAKNPEGQISQSYGDVVVAFDPYQIKSADDNSGHFDPDNIKIRHAKSDCGANTEGGGGFQPGNTCAGDGDSSADKPKEKKGVSAFHGTGTENIKKFDTSKVGSGEGNIAFGWGMYFTEKKDIARWYQEGVTGHVPRHLEYKVINSPVPKSNDLSGDNIFVTSWATDQEFDLIANDLMEHYHLANQDEPRKEFYIGQAHNDIKRLEDWISEVRMQVDEEIEKLNELADQEDSPDRETVRDIVEGLIHGDPDLLDIQDNLYQEMVHRKDLDDMEEWAKDMRKVSPEQIYESDVSDGSMYEVLLDIEPTKVANWNKPMWEQPDYVYDKLRESGLIPQKSKTEIKEIHRVNSLRLKEIDKEEEELDMYLSLHEDIPVPYEPEEYGWPLGMESKRELLANLKQERLDLRSVMGYGAFNLFYFGEAEKIAKELSEGRGWSTHKERREAAKQISLNLLAEGVPAIRYRTQDTRSPSLPDEEASFNYVMFDPENMVEIMEEHD